jgi:signal transduction histidine kinase
MVSDKDGVLSFDISIAGRLDEGRIDRLRDRIEALDGRLTVDDRPDGGARVHGWLPLSR